MWPTTIRSQRCSSATSRIASAASPDAREGLDLVDPGQRRVLRADSSSASTSSRGFTVQARRSAHGLLLAQALIGHRLVGADDLEPGAESAGQLDRVAHRDWPLSEPSVPTTMEANMRTLSRPYASRMIAITIPASTNTTISTCIHIHNFGMALKLPGRWARP